MRWAVEEEAPNDSLLIIGKSNHAPSPSSTHTWHYLYNDIQTNISDTCSMSYFTLFANNRTTREKHLVVVRSAI